MGAGAPIPSKELTKNEMKGTERKLKDIEGNERKWQEMKGN